jgi:Leucine-rich repeat (LRR) protein
MSAVATDAESGENAGSGDSYSVTQNERQRLYESSPDLQALCRDNGISEQQFARRSDSVTTLEMFLGFWESMKSVMYFPALRELYIVNHPTVRVLEGVNKCVNLEVLVVTECSLTHIGHSISSCTKLRKINLSSNKLRRIDNLDMLAQLEILWVNENSLETLDGLRDLTNLSQLWVCRNQIDRLDSTLNTCMNLTELNLAGNRLSSFKSLLPLANLDGLLVLTLSDPHFGDNPVCRLCNYQTYLMCHLSHLTFLDTMEVSQRNKQIAEATMVKKKVYYNMRIRSIRREARVQIQRYESIRCHAEQQNDSNVMALLRQKKEIECFLSEHEQSVADGAPRENQATVQLEKKLECLNVCLEQQYRAIHRLNLDFDRLCADMVQVSDRNASRLLLELETAGNIRLEDGRISDAWYTSCVDLLRSRLFVDELEQFGIMDVRIGRVTRVSNRFLRNRFHSRMEEIVVAPELDAKENVSKKGVTVHSGEDKSSPIDQSAENSSGKCDESTGDDQQPKLQFPDSSLDKSVEYLFYLQPPGLDPAMRSPNAEQYFVAENGFRDPTEYAKAGIEGAIRLSNSISVLDVDRIRAELFESGRPRGCAGTQIRNGSWNDGHGFATLPPRVLMVVKAFPGYTKCMSSADVSKASSLTGKGAAVVVRSEDYAGLHSLQLLPSIDSPAIDTPSSRQKVYYVFDKALVLPEYLVEYQYVMRGEEPSSTSANANAPEFCPQPMINVPDATSRVEEMNSAARGADPLTDEEYATLGLVSQYADEFERRYRPRRRHGAIDGENSGESIARVLQMGPVLPDTTSLGESVSTTMISSKLKVLDLRNIKSINLIGCQLQAVPDLSAVSERLETLVLSYNSIQTTTGLSGLTTLRILDLSFNQIGQLGHLDDLQSLESLDICHNLLKAFGDVEYLGRAFVSSSLRRLDLQKNAFCDSKRYRLHVLQSLPFLNELDHQSVGAHEVTAARQLITKLSSAKVWELCARHNLSLRTRSPATEPSTTTSDGPESEDNERDVKISNLSPHAAEAWHAIEEVALSRELISTIEGLELAVNLHVATFADNVLSRISGLESCRRLEELCLDDNEIERIEHLEHLTKLKMLHLGRNKISIIEGLDSLENLVQLSLEDNSISSLRGLSSLAKLMELYLGNNKVEVLKEVQHLKSLPKLTILDLTGNEICRLPDYRVYTVYHLRRVKVLDGATVSPQDQSTAKQKYSGKLTLELVMEKCGIGGAVTPRSGSALERIIEMDLSSCRLRDLGVLSCKNFPNVRDINLENNQISDISGMEALPSLRTLNLNRNRIERLIPVIVNGSSALSPRSSSSNGLLKGILACTKLEHLYLGYNHISDMSILGLQFMQDLKVRSLPHSPYLPVF